MAKTSTLAALLSVSLLAACGGSGSGTGSILGPSPKEASKENFKKVIDGYLSRSCGAVVGPDLNDYKDYPAAVEIETPKCFTAQGANQRNSMNDQHFMPFVKAGLLSVSEGSEPRKIPTINCKENVQMATKIYSLTELGKKYVLYQRYDHSSFCAGHYKVDDIVRFTEPANMYGKTVTEVSYTYSFGDAPDWAKNPDVISAYPALKQFLAANQLPYKRVMILNSDGWRDEKDN